MFNYTSKIHYANPQSKSLRVGIPKEIVKILEVEPGDTMNWEVNFNNDEITVIAKKLE